MSRPIEAELRETVAELCRSRVVDLRSGATPHWLRLGGVVKELYDVGVLPGIVRPMAVGFQTDEIRRYLSFPRDDTSNQGSALVAATPPNRQTPKDPHVKTPHLHPTHCTWCLSADEVKRFGHLSANCSKIPSRNPGTRTPPPTTPAQITPTSQRLRALLGQLDHAADTETSNTTMLIAEAAISASDYPDSA